MTGNFHSRRPKLPPTLARLPPLTSLRAFVATARHLNFTRAAEELHVTTAAVGQQVRLLEQHLGQQLFHRDRGQLHLTLAGQTLMPGLTEAFEAVLDAVAQLADNQGRQPVKVSVAPSFAAKWLIPRLDAMRDAIPGLEVIVDASTRLADPAVEDIDCVIRYGPGAYPGLVSEKLFSEAVAPVCSPEFAAVHGLHRGPEMLRTAPVLHEDGPERDTSCPGWRDWLRSHGMSSHLPEGGVRLSQSSLVLDAAVAGKGIGLGKLQLAEADLASGRLIVPFGQPQPVDFSYHFASTPRKAKLSGVQLFRDWLGAEARRLDEASLNTAPPPQYVAMTMIAAE